MVSVGTVSRILNNYGKLVFDTQYNEVLTAAIKNSTKASKAAGHSRFFQFDKQIKNGLLSAESATKDVSFFNSMKNSVTSFPADISGAWKSGEGFLKNLKSVGSQIGKRWGLIGAAITLAFEIPNIFRATKDEGLGSGIVETGKAAGRLGLATICGAIGQAICPVPLVGSLVGFMAGDWLFSSIFGKTYSEKKDQEQEQLAQMQGQATQYNPLAMSQLQGQTGAIDPMLQQQILQQQIQQQPTVDTSKLIVPQYPSNQYGCFGNNIPNYGAISYTNPMGQNSSMAMQQLMQMKNNLNGGAYSDDIMFNRLNAVC